MLQSNFSSLQSASLVLSSPGVDLEHFAMVARGSGCDNGKGKGHDRLCVFCGKQGHTVDAVGVSMVSLIVLPKVLSHSMPLQAVAVTLPSHEPIPSAAVQKDVILMSKEEYDRLLHSQLSSVASIPTN